MTTKNPLTRREQINEHTNGRRRPREAFKERVTDIGHGKPPTIQEIIQQHVRVALREGKGSDADPETLEEFEDWGEDPDHDTPWTEHATLLLEEHEPFHVPVGAPITTGELEEAKKREAVQKPEVDPDPPPVQPGE